jgi:tetratricopeptide (TPR) repeat protein
LPILDVPGASPVEKAREAPSRCKIGLACPGDMKRVIILNDNTLSTHGNRSRMKQLECSLTRAENHYWHGLVLLDSNALDEAEAAFSRALELNPFHSECLFWRAAVAKQTGNRERSLACLIDIACLEGISQFSFLELATLQIELGDADTAFTNFARYVSSKKSRHAEH